MSEIPEIYQPKLPASTEKEKPITFEDIIFQLDNYAVDYNNSETFKASGFRRWSLHIGKTWLIVTIENNKAEAYAAGFGHCVPLIAVTPQELKENIIAWTRNH